MNDEPRYTETQVMDAMCLIETIGETEEMRDLYVEHWHHGIYEFRDRIATVAKYTHDGWKYVVGEDDTGPFCCFDSMYCPDLVAYLLTKGVLQDAAENRIGNAVSAHALIYRRELEEDEAESRAVAAREAMQQIEDGIQALKRARL